MLLIVLDTVRAESLGLYGYPRDTTPNLARLGTRGVRFDRAFSTAPWTAPSHASMFTGRWAHELSVGWNAPLDGPDFLHELLSEVKSKYAVDSRRMYLFGHSGGATFALYMGLFESEYFAAVAIHAGALLPEDGPIVERASRKIPIHITVGTVDPFFPLAAVRATRDMLVKAGFAVELTEMKGHDHWYYDLAPKINAEAWTFLKEFKLADEPRYKQYSFNK